MRFLVGFVLALIGVVLVQSKPVVRQASGSLVDLQGLDPEFDEFLALLAEILPPDQYQAFEQELSQLIMNEVSNGLDPVGFELKFQILLEKYLGAFLESRSDLRQSHLATKLVKAVIANVHKTIGKRQATGSLVDLQSLNPEFDEFLALLAAILPPDQYQAFEQELFQLIMNEVSNGLDPVALELKFQILLEKYLGAYLESRSDLRQSHLATKLVKAVIANVHKTVVKRQATDTLTLPTANLEAILAAIPELSALIDPIHKVLAQLATVLSPAELQSLQDQAVELILSLAAGHIDENQFKEKLQALIQQYFNSNGRNQIDIDNLIEKILVTDTAGLPDIIVNILGKRPIN